MGLGATTVGGGGTGGSLQGHTLLVRQHEVSTCSTVSQQEETLGMEQSPANARRTPVGTCGIARNARIVSANMLTERAEAIWTIRLRRASPVREPIEPISR